MQLVVYGRSGVGKTTLLRNKLRQLYEYEIVSPCMHGTTVEDLLRDAFDRLGPYYLETKQSSKKRAGQLALEADYNAVKGRLEISDERSSTDSEKRALPPQLTPRFLAQLLGAVNACWVLDDFHKVADEEKKKLAQMMKVFVDLATDYPTVKIVAMGAVASPRQIIQADPEMQDRLAQIHVPLMTEAELNAIMDKGEELLNVRFLPRIRSRIVHLSNGLPAVCHQLCLNMCMHAGIVETVPTSYDFMDKDFDAAGEQWIADKEDSLREAYEVATRAKRVRTFDNCRLILHALSDLGPDGGTHNDILREIRKRERSYPPGNLTQYLRELQDEERRSVLWYDTASGRYSFSSPMMHTYVRAVVHHQGRIPSFVDLVKLLEQLTEGLARGRARS